MFTQNLIFIVFVSLVVIYIILNPVKPVDIWLIFTSLLVLLFTLSSFNRPQKHVESFQNPTTSEITLSELLSVHGKLELEENIKDIKPGLVFYTTSFNNSSYTGYGKNWLNIARLTSASKASGSGSGNVATPPPTTASPSSEKCETDAKSLDFEITPNYSRKTGFYLSNNRLVGPMSNNLGIQFHNTYTIVVVAKYGNMLVNNKNDEIELIKLYANSPNNNGLSLFIKANSITNVNNVQMGALMFQYASMPPTQCLISQNDDLIRLSRDELVFYFIIKDVDHVKIVMMTDGSHEPIQLVKFNVSPEDITFSNKEFVINRLLNWNANIYNFGIYNTALTNDDVAGFHNHVMEEYMKNIDTSFGEVLNKYNTTLDYLTNMLKCPYDAKTCEACGSITNWLDPSQLMLASPECKQAVNSSCSTNTKENMCKCWDRSLPSYNTEPCRIYRSIFGDKEANFLQYLSFADIEFIKKKYKLISFDECPKHLETSNLLKTNYSDYEYGKLKVAVPGAQPTLSPLDKNGDPKSCVADGKKHDKELNKLMIKKPADKLNSAVDLFNNDPNFTDERSSAKTLAGQKYSEIAQLAEREQNSHLRIGQAPREIKSDFPDVGNKKQTNEMSNVANTNPDSFFSRFIKIMVPSSK